MPGSGPIRVEGFVERLQDAIEGHAVDADMVVEPFHMTRPGDACKGVCRQLRRRVRREVHLRGLTEICHRLHGRDATAPRQVGLGQSTA